MTIRYGVIYADPPWRFATYSAKGKGRSAEAHYDCMPLHEIRRLQVAADWAAEACALFLWTTDPMLPMAIQTMSDWGFTYKTVAFTWVKGLTFMGCGYWTRANPEMCLFGTRGKPKRLSRSVRQLIVSPRREHSRKPDEAYERIEALCGGPYLELFGRFDRPGWDRLGNEMGVGERRWRSDMGAP